MHFSLRTCIFHFEHAVFAPKMHFFESDSALFPCSMCKMYGGAESGLCARGPPGPRGLPLRLALAARGPPRGLLRGAGVPRLAARRPRARALARLGTGMSVDELNEFKPNELGSRAEPRVCQFFSREGSGKFEMNQGMRALSKDRFYPEAGGDGPGGMKIDDSCLKRTSRPH